MELNYISARGEKLPLVGNDLFYLTNIDGQTAAKADIASSVTGGTDGETVNSVQAEPRPIVLDLRIKSGVDVEYAKRAVLRIVKLKQRGTLEWKQNDRDDIMSYADLEWSEGTVYEQLGFTLEGKKDPVLFGIDSEWNRRPFKQGATVSECNLFYRNFGSNKYRLKLTEYE